MGIRRDPTKTQARKVLDELVESSGEGAAFQSVRLPIKLAMHLDLLLCQHMWAVPGST